MKFPTEIVHKLKDMLGKGNEEKPPKLCEEAEKAIVLEKFRLMAASGSEGQAPVVTYGDGNTVILSDLPKGTIIREKYVSDEHPGDNLYIFWYVGESDSEGHLTMYDATHKRNTDRKPYLENVPDLNALKRSIPPNRSNKVELEIGKPGIILDLDFKNRPQSWFNQMQKGRQTSQVDIMEFGKRIKQEVKQQDSVPLGQLVPSPQAI